MTIRLFKRLILPLFSMFFMSAVAARALGTTQPPNPALAGFTEGCEDKPQPCWYGIVPGVTDPDNAIDILSQLGYDVDDVTSGSMRQLQAKLTNYTDCGRLVANVDRLAHSLYDFGIYPCEKIALGDFLAEFGIPDISDISYRPCSVRLTFPNHYLEIIIDDSIQLPDYIESFELLSDDASAFSADFYGTRLQWSGTLPIWRYKARLVGSSACH